MRVLLVLFVDLIVTLIRLAGPGGVRFVVAETALVRNQMLILNRGRKRAPNLRAVDRIIAGLRVFFMRPALYVTGVFYWSNLNSASSARDFRASHSNWVCPASLTHEPGSPLRLDPRPIRLSAIDESVLS
jgi:hypothetical protein